MHTQTQTYPSQRQRWQNQHLKSNPHRTLLLLLPKHQKPASISIDARRFWRWWTLCVALHRANAWSLRQRESSCRGKQISVRRWPTFYRNYTHSIKHLNTASCLIGLHKVRWQRNRSAIWFGLHLPSWSTADSWSTSRDGANDPAVYDVYPGMDSWG